MRLIDAGKLPVVLSSLGVKAEEAAEAFARMARYIPPLGETEEELIKRNPNISKLQKWRLIRKIRRARNRGGKKDEHKTTRSAAYAENDRAHKTDKTMSVSSAMRDM